MKFKSILKSILEVIFVGIFFLIMAFIFTYPSINTFSTHFIGDSWDNYEYAGYIGLASKNLNTTGYPFTDTNFWRFPVGFEFSRGFDSYITVSIGTILHQFLSLTTAYNATIMTIMTLNGIASYYFFRLITKTRLLGITGGIMYGFSFYAIAKASSHPNLLTIGTFPILGFFIYKTITKKSISFFDYLFLILSLVLISLGSVQYLLIAFVFLALYSLTLIAFDRKLVFENLVKIKNSFSNLLIALPFGVIIFLIFFHPHLSAFISNELVILDRGSILNQLTPSLSEYVLPNKYLHLQIGNFIQSASFASIEKVVFIGWIEILFIVLFFFSKVKLRLKLILGTFLLIPLLLSLGYGENNMFSLLPYRFIKDIFPFSVIVETGRYIVPFYLIATICIVLFLQSIRKYKKIFITLTTIFIIGIIIERLPSNFYSANSFENEKYAQIVSTQNSKAVLDLPINPYYAPYDVLSLKYNKPIVNGYFHWSADNNNSREFIFGKGSLNRFICSEIDNTRDEQFETEQNNDLLSTLKEHEISTVVIHLDDKYLHDTCANVRYRIAQLFPEIFVMPTTSSDKEEEITMSDYSNSSKFTLYFPTDGVFHLGGVYIAPNKMAEYKILKNSQEAIFESLTGDTNHTWNTASDFSMQLSPQHSLFINVNAGDVITIESNQNIESAYMSMWYRYIPNPVANFIPYQPNYETIYKDEKAIIYKIK